MRFKFLKVVYIFIFAAISIRLFYWQVIMFDELSVRAEQQHLVSFRLEAPRGSIFSADGALMGSNKPSFLLFGLPKIIKNPDEAALKLAQVIVSDHKEIQAKREDIRSKLSQDLYWVILEKSISLELKGEIEKIDIEGIGFENIASRLYPEGSSAAHILGFVGADAMGKQTGYFGVEGFYNGQLKGVGGILTEEKDARGLPILMGKFLNKEPKKGNDLILNIDRTVQYTVEKNLKAGVEKYGAKSGSVVVMDPKTGAILAMASFPNYDPGDFASFPKEYFKNPIVADSYEPGSTFKVLVMAAALNENLVKPDTKCDNCSGPVQISGYTIRTWNNQYQKELSMTDAIIHSDNTGMVFAGKKLGVDKLYEYIKSFGFGTLTGIDLQDETSPDIRPKNDWREIDLATASFGQGIAVTPMQIVRAVGVLANGGKLMEPQVVSKIRDEGRVTEIKPRVVRQPISEETAKAVASIMVDAVVKGEARVFAPKGFKIAGKTGTAQIPVAGHYDANKTIASFVGFAPADDPKFVMLVRYEEPTSSIYGAETAAPTFFEIAKELLAYYNIAPTE
ncbi:hypothetical protein A3A14_04455 [Candidatus Daviesbacteria bacterium RIFCSPLOWO2_01_FULL_43_38]|uniref:Peptidoglycan glycosyltransferase n=1 Tax=Candidatus Daviesbacteria bacterium GW2011_GWA2_42_7 TaxID=1618425 RepID=A0A0G1DIJ0_9BACT|nr:MAG: Peptidoglycan glycosyltransferase [Candidatus Daviesbacteria bacterium GW2011_GWA2_42_7]OGE63783.1 MAG: hypothetical protein A3A14_04455 [Candidatus Daviesbacteria bacterium RIFCSPLOWO2_01_FULL_43_38]